jgi:oligoribonuclease NrnB/cAMP/cGMP phosphodiesterase (DHH superfamily)
MQVFYHDDADGHCSAFWVYLSVGVKDTGGDSKFTAINYNDTFPLESIKQDEQIYIVDFSIEPDVMTELLKITEDVTWIDHHKTAIDKYDNFSTTIKGLRYDGIAGCELTYAYIHKMNTDRGVTEDNIIPFEKEMLDDCPLFTRLLGDRDVWKFAFGDKSKYFHEAYLLAGSPRPEDDWWLGLTYGEEKVNKEIEKGKLCEEHSKALNKSAFDSWGYEANFKEHKIIVCNSTNRSSSLFGDLIKDYPFVAVYTHDGNQFMVSLYSVNMDVVDIAKEYGGGGHNRACGFVCDVLPWEKIGEEEVI